MMPRRQMLFLLPLAALAGCSAAPATYYRLIPIAGPILHSQTATIRLRDIGVPAYLDGSGVAQPSSEYEYAASANNLWAEPLPGMLQSILVQNLTQRLPQMTITSANGAIGAPADFTIELNILRFDPDATGRITLIAQAALKQANGSFLFTRTLQSTATPAGPDLPSTMAAMSTLWASLSDTLAEAIATP